MFENCPLPILISSYPRPPPFFAIFPLPEILAAHDNVLATCTLAVRLVENAYGPIEDTLSDTSRKGSDRGTAMLITLRTLPSLVLSSVLSLVLSETPLFPVRGHHLVLNPPPSLLPMFTGRLRSRLMAGIAAEKLKARLDVDARDRLFRKLAKKGQVEAIFDAEMEKILAPRRPGGLLLQRRQR